MRDLVAQDLPISRMKILTSEVRARYAEQGLDDKTALLDTRPRLYSDLYTLAAPTATSTARWPPSTGYIDRFCIEPYYNGFYLALPLRTRPACSTRTSSRRRCSAFFQEYQSWVRIMGVPTVGAVNSKVLAGDAGGMIKLAEAFHERKFAWVADTIYDANLSRGVRMVLISGPSSSGKTTSAKRLGIQLGVLGLQPVLISLDDYFVDREKTPKDADGDYDYEALEAIDLELFNDHLRRLMRGESVDIPRYNFITGRRTQHNNPLTLDERSILIVEGIHGLNPRLTPSVPEAQKFRIYISCFTSVAMDNLSRIATTDNRLLRRLTRDYTNSGADAWRRFRAGAPSAAARRSTSSPIRKTPTSCSTRRSSTRSRCCAPYAEKILREVPDTVPEYDEARRMLKFLKLHPHPARRDSAHLDPARIHRRQQFSILRIVRTPRCRDTARQDANHAAKITTGRRFRTFVKIETIIPPHCGAKSP